MSTEITTTKDNLNLTDLGQDDIPKLLKMVQKKIDALVPKKAKTGTTNGASLSGFGAIKSIDTVEGLTKAYSVVNAKENAYEEAASELNVDIQKYPFKLQGYTGKVWKADIAGRIQSVENKTELVKLTKVKIKLEANLSAKAKLAKDLGDINKILLS